MFQSKNNDGSSSPCQFSSRTFIESMLKGFGSSSVTHRPIDIHILTHLHSPSMDSYVLVVHDQINPAPFFVQVFLHLTLQLRDKRSSHFLRIYVAGIPYCLATFFLSQQSWTQRRSSIKPSPHLGQIVGFSPCHEKGEKMLFLNFSHNRHAYYVLYTILQFVFKFFPYCTSLGYSS